ncbi:hypothetical protein RND81_04G085400 [Saponaria officinalis]|uniref:Secreted protein n=1 Tax=Saponaria officinalis TaxID=3572 RepID=A0AAW1LDI0_SAPOF
MAIQNHKGTYQGCVVSVFLLIHTQTVQTSEMVVVECWVSKPGVDVRHEEGIESSQTKDLCKSYRSIFSARI